MTESKLFGTDGIRGLANSATMNTEIAVALGRAVAYYVREGEELPKIVIGKDTRRSGYMLETALSSGITSMGLDVVQTGPLPTPGIAFICRSMRARLGIVISASHNPSDHNGIKVFWHDGFKLNHQQEGELEELMASGVPEKHLALPTSIGSISQLHDAAGRYVQHLKESFPHRLTLKGLKIALDTANGAAYRVAPAVFSELGANVIVKHKKPNGLNINDRCGALHPEVVCRLTKDEHADIGITLDGDADRVLLSDEHGNFVDGDAILYISAKHLYAKGALGGAAVVGTVMTNYALDAALKAEGIALARTDVGDYNVVSYMRAHGINLGGETCGHLFYLHHGPSGDGILAALRILSIMQQQKKPLSALVGAYKPFPQKTINVPVYEKTAFDRVPEIMQAQQEVERQLEGRGRVLIRYSGTEMLARVMVESNDAAMTEEMVKKLAEVVERNLGEKKG